jgi:hypothetical protein
MIIFTKTSKKHKIYVNQNMILTNWSGQKYQIRWRAVKTIGFLQCALREDIQGIRSGAYLKNLKTETGLKLKDNTGLTATGNSLHGSYKAGCPRWLRLALGAIGHNTG